MLGSLPHDPPSKAYRTDHPFRPSTASAEDDASAEMKLPPAFPSLESIREELLRKTDVARPAGDLRIEPLPGDASRPDRLARKHFRVSAGEHTLFRLTVGPNLKDLWERSRAFAEACPEIACPPLFCHRAGEWDYLAIEFFPGRNLEELFLDGGLTSAETVRHVTKIMTVLGGTEQPSTREAATQEIEALFRQVGSLPIFDRFDQSFLQQAVFPIVRTGALTGPFHTRWTNGDLIPRNVLVDQQGQVRLVDYEFANRTHFFAEDGWRWRAFSNLPAEMRDLPGLGVSLSKEPWLEVFFLLKQLVLINEGGGNQPNVAASRPVLDWLVAVAARAHDGFRSSAFLQPLAPQSLPQKNEQTPSELLALGRAVIADALDELTRLRNLLYQREEKIRAMRSSFSWNVTAPLRALRRMLLDRFRPKQPAPPDPARMPALNFFHSPRDFDDVSPSLRFGVEQPHLWDTLAGPLQVRGWCFTMDKIRVNAVRARLGEKIFSGVYGQPRPDIAAQYTQLSQAESCGFFIDLEIVPHNRHLVIEAGDEHGKWHRLLTRRPGKNVSDEYARWVRDYDTLTSETLERIRASLGSLQRRPLISVLMPVYNTAEKWLVRAIDSVRAQIYENWELCIADDASTAPYIRPLLEKAAEEDPRIKIVFRETNGHISAASNSALTLARGEFVALLDHDDELRPHALACVVREFDRFPDADLVYSDEDKLTETGFRFCPYFKPDWNPDLFLAQNFICHLAAYRTSLVRELGGFRIGCEGAQDWDLALRVVERTIPQHIRHIPRILYHWRAVQGSTAVQISEKKYSVAASEKVLADHLARTGLKAVLAPTEGDYWRVRYPLPQPVPRVTLIIPTRNQVKVLRPCVTSILKKTSYPDYEILVVDNDSNEPDTCAYLEELRRQPRCRVLAFPGPFNFSAINNFAVRQTDAPLVGLLNNDLEVINGDWLDEMAEQAFRPEIGCVGAKLYYPDGRIQHAGVVLGVGGVAGHAFKYLPRDAHGPQRRPHLVQNFSAVTAACMVIRRETFLRVGGFDENIAVAFNDVDFCLKTASFGYRNLYTPFAELLHHESASRGYEDNPEKQVRFSKETEYVRRKWGDVLLNDPAYNPNLTLECEDFSPAFPPRVANLTSSGNRRAMGGS